MTYGLLRPGQVVFAEESRLACRIGDLLGGGGQGEVYRAELGGETVAVKWYRTAVASSAQRQALEELVRRGTPSPAFLWPMDIVTAPRTQAFGYVMPIRDYRFVGMSELVRRRVEPTARVLAGVGLGLAEAFLLLHAQGLCYRDISFGNAFFDPDTGEVLVCDNDNVAIDGSALGGVLGTPRFMAPEVVRGEALPSSRTDLFSLAVLLFMMLFVHHPFEGAREHETGLLDLRAMRSLYGEHPVFVFDPADDSNRPVPGAQQNVIDLWALYPRFLRELFIRSFTLGVRDPVDGRVRESQWRQAMARLRDSVLACDSCGGDAEVFWDPSEPWGDPSCWRCHARLRAPIVLELDTGASLVASPGAELFGHHVVPGRLYDFSVRVGEVVPHPTQAGVVGLRNVSERSWHVKASTGSAQEVPPGKSVRIAPGSIIDFGPSNALARAGA